MLWSAKGELLLFYLNNEFNGFQNNQAEFKQFVPGNIHKTTPSLIAWRRIFKKSPPGKVENDVLEEPAAAVQHLPFFKGKNIVSQGIKKFVNW